MVPTLLRRGRPNRTEKDHRVEIEILPNSYSPRIICILLFRGQGRWIFLRGNQTIFFDRKARYNWEKRRDKTVNRKSEKWAFSSLYLSISPQLKKKQHLQAIDSTLLWNSTNMQIAFLSFILWCAENKTTEYFSIRANSYLLIIYIWKTPIKLTVYFSVGTVSSFVWAINAISRTITHKIDIDTFRIITLPFVLSA